MQIRILFILVALLLGPSVAIAQHSPEAISAQIIFDAPFNQSPVSGCTSGEKLTGIATSPTLANLVITTTPVVITGMSVQNLDNLAAATQATPMAEYIGFTGTIDIEQALSQTFPNQELGVLVIANMWDVANNLIASQKVLIVPCKIHLPLVVE